LVARNKIESANGIVTAVHALSDVAAPILGGILYKIIGINALIILSCIAFFLSAVMEILSTHQLLCEIYEIEWREELCY